MENLDGGRNVEKDTLTQVEAPVTQASDTDPGTAAGPATAPPDVQTPLEGASSGMNVGQESPGPGENEEMENMSVLISNLSAEADGQCPEVSPVDATVQGPNTLGNAGRKGSRKGRNRKQTKIVYLPWPLTLQTRASSAAPVLRRSHVLGALAFAIPRDGEVGEDREQGEDEGSENTSTLAEPQEELADAIGPAASAVQPSLVAPLAADEGLNPRQKNSRKGRNKKNKKIMASPWPLTVHAWASYTNLARAHSALAKDESLVEEGVDGGHPSQGREGEARKVSAKTPYQSTLEEAPDPAEDLKQGSWEKRESFSADSMGNRRTSRRADSKRKEKGVWTCPWPLTVQAWASFRAADEVQTHLQGQSSAASRRVDVGQKKQIQLVTGEEEIKSTPPVSKAELSLEPRQGWRSTERCQGDQDFWECTVRNFARQADRCYCGERNKEQKEALTLTKAHTHISTSVMGIRGPEKERAETQAVWMSKWGGF